MRRLATRSIDPVRAAAHLVTHLAAARETGDPTTIPRSFVEADPAVVRQWPDWVGRAAALRSRGAWWLWCEPRKGARSGAGQVVMDVPAGRYVVDLMDTRVHAWFSRESAAGLPLVAGLPATGQPVLARIRRVSRSSPVPKGDVP
jgi:hypothetical protein